MRRPVATSKTNALIASLCGTNGLALSRPIDCRTSAAGSVNASTAHGGLSTWGWAQNSLIAVDAEARTFRYTHDYYLLKHLTHFVDIGARRLDTSGTCDDALAFLNPNGTIVTLLRNELPHPQTIQIQLPDRQIALELPPDSIATLTSTPA